jgi:hypothetical protein
MTSPSDHNAEETLWVKAILFFLMAGIIGGLVHLELFIG